MRGENCFVIKGYRSWQLSKTFSFTAKVSFLLLVTSNHQCAQHCVIMIAHYDKHFGKTQSKVMRKVCLGDFHSLVPKVCVPHLNSNSRD